MATSKIPAAILDTNTQIPGSKDAMVLLAFEQNWVISAINKNTQNVTLNAT